MHFFSFKKEINCCYHHARILEKGVGKYYLIRAGNGFQCEVVF